MSGREELENHFLHTFLPISFVFKEPSNKWKETIYDNYILNYLERLKSSYLKLS